MTEKIFELEVGPDKEIVLRFHRLSSPVIHQATREHLHNSTRELLLSLRSLLDGAIELMEAKQPAGKKKTKIEVQ